MTGSAGVRTSNGTDKVAAGTLVAAMLVEILDGFDTFSIRLVAPKLAADLTIPMTELGVVFAGETGGMILGSFAAGPVVAALGRINALLGALILMAATASLTLNVHTVPMLLLCRIVAGIALGAAAPIAVGLLNHPGAAPPSDLVVNIVWSGTAIGGIVAAAFNFFVVTSLGWHPIFQAGGALPLLGAIVVWAIYRRRDPADRAGAAFAVSQRASRNLPLLLKQGRAVTTVLVSLTSLFGFITASLIFVWLPTIMTHEGASSAAVSQSFAALNVGAVLSLVLMGVVSVRVTSRLVLVSAWAITGATVIVASLPQLPLGLFATIAVIGATFGVGTQGLTSAFANRIYHEDGLEIAMVGCAIGIGRVGQFVGLALASVLLGLGIAERGLITIGGVAACIAAFWALLAVRRAARWSVAVPAPRRSALSAESGPDDIR